MGVRIPRLSRRLLPFVDVLVVVWAAVWLGLGLLVGTEVHRLTQLSDSVEEAGGALEETGEAVGRLSDVPFVGDRVAELAERISATGRQAARDADDSRDNIRALSILLAVAIALVPTAPIAAVYLPLRAGWMRESRAVRRALRARRDDERFDELLARRAVEKLPYDRLLAVSDDPWADLAAGRFRALADAELRRVGVRRPRPEGGRGAET